MRQDEGRFGQVHLPGNGLHFLSAQAPRIGVNRQLVPLQRPGREHTELDIRKRASCVHEPSLAQSAAGIGLALSVFNDE